MRKGTNLAILILGALSFTAPACWAQSSTGTILGTIKDTSGSVVPEGTVVVLNEATNIRRSTVPNAVGDFVFPFLPVGPYALTVEHPGFKREVRSNLVLEVDQKLRIDITLSPGAVTETVNVTASTSLLNTDTSATGEVVVGQQIIGLPLNGRNYQQLALLVPGVVKVEKLAFDGLFSDPADVSMSASGQRAEQNNFIIDGIDNKEPLFNQPAVKPSVDAIAEFKVITGIAPAEYGRGGGAIISVVTKSGSNQLHGNLFEFLRNNAFDSRNYFASNTSHLVRNEPGGSLGGPVVIPGLYNGQDKTFFFVNVDLLREHGAGAPPILQVPTQQMRNGVFPTTIIDPTTGLPFANNTIPSGRIDPVALKLQAFYPQENNPADPARNFIFNGVASTYRKGDSYTFRVDHQISARDNFYIRYSLSDDLILQPPTTPTGVGAQNITNITQGAVASEVHSFGPEAVNELTFGWQHRNFSSQSPDAYQKDILSGLGFHAPLANPQLWKFPSLNIEGFSALSDGTTIIQRNDIFQIQDSVAIRFGKHSFRTGIDIRRIPHSKQAFYGNVASWNFGGPSFTGQPYADFLLGIPQTSAATLATHLRNESQTFWAGYFQDDWKVTPNLTLNLGLRYEYEAPLKVADNVFAGIDLKTGTLLIPKSLEPIAGPFYSNVRTNTPVQFINENTPYDGDKNNFAYRVGSAYRIRGGKTVVRAGAGLFYVSPPWESYTIDTLAPFVETPSYTSNTSTPTLSFQTPFQGSVGNLATVPLTVFPFGTRNILLGYNQQWMLEFQRELSSNWLAAITYTGSSGHHMPRLASGDLAGEPGGKGPGPGPLQDRLPFPWFARIEYLETQGNSSYEGVAARLEKRFSGGSGALFSYTYSKAIDDAASTNLVIEDSSPAGIRSVEKGLSDNDVRHNFAASATYILPFGAGRRFLSHTTTLVNAVLGDWELGGIAALHSGNPLTVSMNPARVNFGVDVTARPNRIANGNLPSGQRTVNRWFDTSAFVLPPPFTPGTAGRNIIVAPGTVDFDLSLAKKFQLREHCLLQVRGEFFNALNHPNFTNVDTSIEDTSTFGKVLGAADPRIIQLGIRIDF